MDPFRDDREGLHHRIDDLEEKLAETKAELERERHKNDPKPEPEPKPKKPDAKKPIPKTHAFLAAGVIGLLAVAGIAFLSSRKQQEARMTVATPPPPVSTDKVWDGRPIDCREGHYIAKNVIVRPTKTTGYVAQVGGTCVLELENADILAARAFTISEHGRVILHGGRVEGTIELAYFITADGKIELDHATAIGPELYDHAIANFKTGVVIGEGSTWTWPAGLTYKWFSAAYCRVTVDASLRDLEARYVGSTGKAGPTSGAAVVLGDFGAGECATRMRTSIAQTPPVDLDTASRAYSQALDLLIEIHKKARAYYRDADYRDDGLALGKKMHPELVAAMDATLEASKGVRAAMDRAREDIRADLSRSPAAEMAAWSLPLFLFDVLETETKADMKQALEAYIAADGTFTDAASALDPKPRTMNLLEYQRTSALVAAKQARRTLVDQNAMPSSRELRRLFPNLLDDVQMTFPHR